LRKMVTRLDASHVFHRMTRLESQSVTRDKVIFTKSLSSWWTNPVRLHTKKWAFFAWVMIKIGGNFLFCLFTRVVLHFKDQVSPTCIRGSWDDFAFTEDEGSAGHSILTPYLWFNVVFAYRDHGSGPHTETSSLFQMPVKWFKFFRFKSKPNNMLQNIMQMRKPNIV